jgi:hypothetical protein
MRENKIAGKKKKERTKSSVGEGWGKKMDEFWQGPWRVHCHESVSQVQRENESPFQEQNHGMREEEEGKEEKDSTGRTQKISIEGSKRTNSNHAIWPNLVEYKTAE